MSRAKAADESLLEALAAVHLDAQKHFEAAQDLTVDVKHGCDAIYATYRLAERAAQAITIAKAFAKATGADASASLGAAVQLVAAEMTAPPEPEIIPETDLDRVVDAIESVATALADR